MGLQHASILSVLTKQRVCVYEANSKIRDLAQNLAQNLCVHHTLADFLNEPKVSAVFLCTPIQTHAELSKLIMREARSEVGLFVEKPLAASLEEAQEVATVAGSQGRKSMVGFQRRFNGVYSKLKNLLETGGLGDLRYYRAHAFSADVLRTSSGWKFEPPNGGAVLDFGVHMMDLLIWYFGQPELRFARRRKLHSKEVEDLAYASLDHRGVVGELEIGWSMRNYAPNEHRIELYGTKGIAVATDDNLVVYHDDQKNQEAVETVKTYHAFDLTPNTPYLFTYPEYVLEDMYFLKCVRENKAASPDFSQALSVNRLAHEILLSALS